MADVTAQARIAAPAGKVWEQLTDFGAYGQWNATHTDFPQGGPSPLTAEAVYFRALPTRLSTTRSMRTGSARTKAGAAGAMRSSRSVLALRKSTRAATSAARSTA